MYFTLQLTLETCLYAYIKKNIMYVPYADMYLLTFTDIIIE